LELAELVTLAKLALVTILFFLLLPHLGQVKELTAVAV
jgi:hypothetical protein